MYVLFLDLYYLLVCQYYLFMHLLLLYIFIFIYFILSLLVIFILDYLVYYF